jgi:hypothetical protein
MNRLVDCPNSLGILRQTLGRLSERRSINLSSLSTKSGSEVYGGFTFQILDRTGRAVEGVTAPFVGREKPSEEYANWERIRDLYEIARRRALHSEKVVSDLFASLDRIA